jgi:hypothetical protein
MKPMSRAEYLKMLDRPRLPLVSVMPDLARGYGWIVRVGVCDMDWCWTRVGAERVADSYRGGAYDSRADAGVVRGGGLGVAPRQRVDGGGTYPAGTGRGAALYGFWLLIRKWCKRKDTGTWI